MFTYSSIFKDSPLNSVAPRLIPLNSLNVGDEIAVSTPLNLCSCNFIIDKVVKITSKRTQITLEKSGKITAKQLENNIYEVCPEIKEHIRMVNEREKLTEFLKDRFRSNLFTTCTEKMYICKMVKYYVYALPEKELKVQLGIFNAVKMLEDNYLTTILDGMRKEEQKKAEKYGAKK